MELLNRSLSSIANVLSRRRVLMGAGVLAAAASEAPLAQAQNVPSNLKFSNPDGMFKPAGYTHVVETVGPGRTVYIAGQLGWDASAPSARASSMWSNSTSI